MDTASILGAAANRSVALYSDEGKVLYLFNMPGTTPLNVSTDLINKVRQTGEISFTIGNRDAIAIHRVTGRRTFIVVVAGHDDDGLERLETLKTILLVGLAASVFITALVSLLFARQLLRPIALIIRVPLARFLRAAAEPVTIAFATASSEAALPRAMENMEALGVPRETVAFVLPTGYSFNLDGSSLYQSLALIFVAQAAGIHLSVGQQLVMLLTLLIASKGVAGVARASLVIVLATATSFHLPLEPVFLLFGIDQLMDMARTGVNVLGNCLATLVIARWEGETAAFSQK